MDQGNIRTLNPYHVVFLIQNVITGIGLIAHPHLLAPMGYNLWWMPLLIGLVAQLTLLPMIVLCRKFPGDSLYEINRKLLGKWAGGAVNAAIAFVTLIVVCPTSETFLRLMQAISFPSRSIMVSLLMLIAVAVYIAGGGIKLVARFCIVSFLVTFWMAFFLQWPWSKGIYTHLLPIGNVPFSKLAEAFRSGYPAYFGYELLLFYFPYIQKPEKAWKHTAIGLWLAVLFYWLVCTVSVVYFSLWQLENIKYPILNLFKSVELAFVQRIENLGLAVWLFLILSTISCYLWTACKGIDYLLGKHRRVHMFACGAICIGILLFASGKDALQKWLYEDLIRYAIFGIIALPIPLLALYGIRKLFVAKGNV